MDASDTRPPLPAGLTASAAALSPDLVRLRRDLHRHPEVGLELPRTRQRVLAALDGLPLEVTTGKEADSITAVLRGGRPGPVVLLRGDMDALPVAEKAPVDYASENGAMHACGHDLHTAMLAGAARLLSERRDLLAGDVLFMFQPGEEGYRGAEVMIREGVLDAAGAPPAAAYAVHVTSATLPRGMFGSRPGPLMAAVGRLRVTVLGAGGHGSVPHQARDPIPAMCEMVLALQTFVTRSFDVFDPVVLTVGSIHAGTADNVIPDSGTFEATIRSFSDAASEKALRECVRVVRGVAAAHGLEVEAEVASLYPPTVNDPAAFARVRDCVLGLYGETRWVELPTPVTASEDFSLVLHRVPGALVFLGAHPPEADPRTAPANHSPHAVFDDAVLADGAALYAALALSHLTPADTPAG